MSDDLRERVAAALWKAQVTDAGTPQSVIDARTPEAFADEHPDTRKTWLKFARAALAEIGGARDAGERDDSTPVDVSDKTKTTYFDSVPAIEAEMKLHKGKE